jgi:putative DNA primase/helicase
MAIHRAIPIRHWRPGHSDCCDLGGRLGPAKLHKELPGILAWALRGCLEWQQTHGLGVPKEVQRATASYRQDMDTVAAFLEDRCYFTPEAKTSGELYHAYKDWCQSNGEHPMNAKALGMRLLDRSQLEQTRVGSAGSRGWAGVGLVGRPQQQGLNTDTFLSQRSH